MALVAVTTPWVPVVKEALEPKGTVIETAFGGVIGDALAVAVTNIGTMSGSVQRIAFSVGDEKSLTTYPLQIKKSSLLVEPGKTIVVKGVFAKATPIPVVPTSEKKCAIDTMFTDAASETHARRDWFECFFALPVVIDAKGQGQ